MNKTDISLKTGALLLAACAAQLAGAADYTWIKKTGSLLTASNWDSNSVPAAADNAYLRGGVATLSEGEAFGPVANYTVGRGWSSQTTNNITGGTLDVSGTSTVGYNGNGYGTVNMSGGKWTTGKLIVSDYYQSTYGACTGGVLNLSGGEIAVTNSTLAIANVAGSLGRMTLSGSGKVDTTAFELNVGYLGTGYLDIDGGEAFVTNNNFVIGRTDMTATGIVEQTAGTVNLKSLRVGAYGWYANGTYTISGGVVTQLVAGETMVGAFRGTGTVNQTGGTVAIGMSPISIGRENGAGYYNISGGTLLSLGDDFGLASKLADATQTAYGEMNISGDAVVNLKTFSIGGLWTYNLGGTGVVNQTGGTVTASQINISRGYYPAYGIYNLSGGTVTTPSFRFAGNDSTNAFGTGGECTLSGGTLNIPKILVANTNAVAIFNFDGGTLKSSSASAAFIPASVTANILAGGALIDTAGYDDTIPASLVGSDTDGGVTKLGAGTLTLTGANNAWTGRTTVKAGTLDLNGMTVNGPVGLAKGGALVNAAVTTGDITTYGDYALSLAAYGAGYTNYAFGAVTADGGTLRLLNNVNGLLGSALAWYDPSDASTLTLDGADVTGLANKGVGGSALDLQAYSDSSRPFVSADYTQNGHSVLVLTNTYGLVSKDTATVTGDVDRTLFAVSKLDKSITTNNNDQMFAIELCNKSAWSWSGLTQIAQWGWTSHVGTYVITNDNQTGEFQSLANLPNPDGLCAVWDLRAAAKVVTGHCYKDRTLFTGSTNTVTTSFNTPAAGNMKFFVGMRNENPCGSEGTVGETFYFGRALSDDETAAVRGYLTDKWLGTGTAPAAGTTKLDSLVLTNNAVVDLDGAILEVGSVSGSGTISNGTLLVTGDITPAGRLALADDAALAGGTLVITLDASGTPTGTLSAAAGLDLSLLTLRVVNGAAFTSKSPDALIIEAADRLSNSFKATNRTAADAWSVRTDAGKAYLSAPKGTCIQLMN